MTRQILTTATANDYIEVLEGSSGAKKNIDASGLQTILSTLDNSAETCVTAYTLPAAVIGQQIAYRRDNAGCALRITPDGLDYFSDSYAKLYKSLDSDGAYIHLYCYNTGIWSIVESRGNISNQALPTPQFTAPLSSSLIPTKGNDLTYTFTRAQASTILDHEGIVRDCVSGEARFLNARRVENLVGEDASEDIEDTYWLKDGASVTVVDATHITIPAAAAGTNGIYNDAVLLDTADTYTLSVTVSVATTPAYFRLYFTGSGSNDILATTTPKRYSFTGVTTDGYYALIRSLTPGGVDAVLTVTDWQVEKVNHQAITAPSEYVSTMSTVDHGTNISGLKYFTTTNANTVDWNYAVTEATGNAICNNTGFLGEQLKTNNFTYSETLTNAAWTEEQVAVSNTLGAEVAGLTKFRLLASNDTSLDHYITHDLTTVSPDSDVVISAFVANRPAADYFYITVYLSGAHYTTQFFNISTGAIGTVTQTGTSTVVDTDSAIITKVKDGYRCSVVVACANNATHEIHFGPAQVDGTTAFAASAPDVGLLDITGAQAQIDHELGQYIRTTTAPVSTVGDTLNYEPTNIVPEKFSVVMEVNTAVLVQSLATLIRFKKAAGNEADYDIGLWSQTGGIRVNQWEEGTPDTKVFQLTTSTLPSGVNKIGVTFSRISGERIVVLNGVEQLHDDAHPDDTDSSTWDVEEIEVIWGGSGTGQADYPINNINIYEALTLTELQSLTAENK